MKNKTGTIALMKLCSRNPTLPGFLFSSQEVAMSLDYHYAALERCLGLSLTPQRQVCLPGRVRDIQVEVVITARILEQTSLDATDRNKLNSVSTRRSVWHTTALSIVCLPTG